MDRSDALIGDNQFGQVQFAGQDGAEPTPLPTFYLLNPRYRSLGRITVASDGRFLAIPEQLSQVYRIAIGPAAPDFFSVEKQRLVIYTLHDFLDQLMDSHLFVVPCEVWSSWPRTVVQTNPAMTPVHVSHVAA